MERALIIMTRVPVAGETKTRLMPNLSGEECVALHEACLNDLIHIQERLQVPTYIYYSGNRTEKFTRMFPSEVKFFPQIGASEYRAGAPSKTLEDWHQVNPAQAELHSPIS